jgi:hypothetical protein
MGRQDTLAGLVWICCAAGLGGCYPDSFGAHPCAGCLECEECVEGVDGPHCAAIPAAIYRCAADGHVHSYDSCDADEGVYDHCPEHAECVEDSGSGPECICPGNWDPTTNCEECLPGWSGADCETQIECYGGWLDPVTSLCWEDPPPSGYRNWESAVAYCDSLVLGSQSDWRMPTISELRSLVRSCPATEPGGECGVTDDCSEFACWDPESCEGCSGNGPGLGGCYWDPSLHGSCGSWHWASTPCLDQPDRAWRILFKRSDLRSSLKTAERHIRCVRSVE